MSQIKAANMRGMADEEKWERMYAIIFPGDENIPSPYKSELCYSAYVEGILSPEIERILYSPSPNTDPQWRIRQIIIATIQAIQNTNMEALREQYNFQGVENPIDTDAMATVHGVTENTTTDNAGNQDYQIPCPVGETDALFSDSVADDHGGWANEFMDGLFWELFSDNFDNPTDEDLFGDGMIVMGHLPPSMLTSQEFKIECCGANQSVIQYDPNINPAANVAQRGIDIERAMKPDGCLHAPDLETIKANADSCDWGAKQFSQISTKKKFIGSSSSSTFDTCANWISDCLSKHDCARCTLLPSSPDGVGQAAKGPISGQNTLPRRLVDLREFSTSSPKIRIVDTDEMAEVEKNTLSYATLSYCWGKESFYKTLQGNLKQSSVNIPHSRLPRTFQDAFVIATRLGAAFIWIDALCIIQDSAADWNVESAKMPYIYSRALFCIAADSSPNAGGGCFNDSDLPLEPAENPIVLRCSNSHGEESLFYLYEDATGRYAPKTIETAPVAQRGWTFQERILSPRILHYTSEQVFWECRKEYRAQDGSLTWLHEGDPYPSMTVAARVVHTRQDPWHLYQDWYPMIGEFTARHLTYSKDKLPALSGIARAYHTGLKCQYIAGLWEYKLGFGLSWHRSDSTPPAQIFRRNSFSWTSIDGAVWWGVVVTGSDEPGFPPTLKSCDIPLVNEHDPFGETGPCSITFTGLLKKAKLAYRECGQGHFDWVVIGSSEYGITELDTVDLDVTMAEEQEHDVWCFPVSKVGAMDLYALVLARVPTDSKEDAKYSRLGLLRIVGDRQSVDGQAQRVCRRCHRGWERSYKRFPGASNSMATWFGECEIQNVTLV
ncbi:het-domain-containing [Trichoderma arundinaceum]|uniref:Het-domain-containing n=1 Tax=Trichoderma arundinaceum TaxID=490622 RepID=A0A395NUJ1_TRIAR|nr:het-domain-containing [Trichoderma arundinaceum]